MAEQKPKDNTQRPLPPSPGKSVEVGLISANAVSENRRPPESLTESINFDFDTIGSAKVRPGLTRIGNQLSGNILGVFNFVNYQIPSQTQLIVANGTTVSYLNAGGYATIRSGLTGGKTRFSTYLNFVFMVNGVDATAVWDGNPSGAFVTSGNASGAPIGAYVESYRGRMWIAGNPTYPDRVFYSSIPSSVVTPVITWNTDPATGQWIDISPSDGDTMTGLRRVRNTLLAFKTHHLYRIYDIGQVDPDPYYAVGTYSMESVLETKVGAFFHDATGIYQYDIYGMVSEVSRPILDIIKAIPVSSYPNVTGWVDPDGDSVNWAVGTVTVNGDTFTNLVIRYKISTQVWTHRTYPTQFLTAIPRQPLYSDSTNQYQIVGDNAGNTYKVSTGTTDDGTAIPYSIIHSWDNIDGLLTTRKIIENVLFNHYGGAKTNVAVQTDDNEPDGLKDWTKKVCQLDSLNTQKSSVGIKGRKIRFKLSGTSSGTPFTYSGYELINVLNEYLQPGIKPN